MSTEPATALLMSTRRNGGKTDYDLIVIGSGSAAFAAAIRARDYSRSVLMIERGITGGTCVNIGCIPSKTLLADSRRASGVSLPDAIARKDSLVAKLRQDKYVDLFDRHGIDLREGDARLTGSGRVSVGPESFAAGAMVIAAGARPAVPEISGLEEAGYLTSTTALEVQKAPGRLAVLGGNAVGLELGQMLAGFGSDVTWIVRGPRLAPFDEPEVSEGIEAVLEEQGHRIFTETEISDVDADAGTKTLRGTRNGHTVEVEVDEILVAAGRAPNTEDLGLEEAGVETDSSAAIRVDQQQRTSAETIFAAGDITTQPRYVYVAAAAGAAAASNALGLGESSLDFAALPRVTFTEPAIAVAGLTEAEAREGDADVITSVLPLDAVPRALANGDTRGLVKLVAEKDSGKLLGASMLAHGAEDAILAAVVAIQAGVTIDQLAGGWAPYLTMAEGLKLAAQTFERDVADLSCCAV